MDHPSLANLSIDVLLEELNAPRISYKIFSATVCFLGIWTNYIIIRTILKNKPMRTPTNAYISNWAIYDLLYLILAPVNFLLEEIVENEITLCIFRDIEGTLEFATILLITMFLFDYFITSKRFLAASWVLIVVFNIISIVVCFVGSTHVNFPQILTNIGYAFLFVIFVIKVVAYNVNKEQQKDSNYRFRLAVTFTYVFCWVFRYIFLYLSYIVESREILPCLARHANIIGYTNSIFNVFILTLLNKQFYTNLFKMLGCRADLNGSPGDENRATQINPI